jgi:hypothetical protein
MVACGLGSASVLQLGKGNGAVRWQDSADIKPAGHSLADGRSRRHGVIYGIATRLIEIWLKSFAGGCENTQIVRDNGAPNPFKLGLRGCSAFDAAGARCLTHRRADELRAAAAARIDGVFEL